MKKLISFIALFPVLVFAQQTLQDPIRVHAKGSSGDTTLCTLVNTNANINAPFLICLSSNQVFAVNNNGSVFIGATTNQVSYGATNSAPVNTSNAVAWISVQVNNDTNVYRLPLYK